MNNVKRLLKRIPMVARAHRGLTQFAQDRATRRIVSQLEGAPYQRGRQIGEALKAFQQDSPPVDNEWVARVEAARDSMLARHDPLVDGTLGEAVSHDHGLSIEQACSASKPRRVALLLSLIVGALKPKNVIELGTNVGISSAYIAGAMALNEKSGKLVTLDASAYRQRLAKQVHNVLGLDGVTYVEGFFTETLERSLEQARPIDLAFIDGHHQYEPTLRYFSEIFPCSSPEAVFIFDDIRWSDGMKKAWAELRADNRVGLAIDLNTIGICVGRRPEVDGRCVFGPARVF